MTAGLIPIYTLKTTLALTEVIIKTVETALEFVPTLLEVPVLGRILVALGFGHPQDATKALEELQKAADAEKKTRQKERDRHARYVLKASDALKCLEDNMMDGQILLDIGKGIVNTVLGKGATAGTPDLIYRRIADCIIEHELRQDTPRVIGQPTSKYVRPRKGHGHGRPGGFSKTSLNV